MQEYYPITVIVPIYNVEKYVERCATPLLETRKSGEMMTKGKYIQHINSDDWVESDMLFSLTTSNSQKSYAGARFLYVFLSAFLQPRITEKQLKLFRDTMLLRLLFVCDALKTRPDITWFYENGFGLRELWTSQQVAFSRKLLYSLRFVNLSKDVVVIRYLRNGYRVVRRKIVR